MWGEGISIFFRLLNFGLLIALFIYLYKRYIAQTLADSMQTQRALQNALEQERDILGEKQTILDMNMQAQEALRVVLMQKIELWKSSFMSERQKHLVEKESLEKRLAEKMDVRKEQYTIEQAQQRILPLAIEKARQQLEKTFESAQKSEAYNAAIIAYLREAE